MRTFHSRGLLVVLVLLASVLAACGTTDDSGGSAPSRDALVVRMLYGSEKQAWIEAVTPAFNAQRVRSTSGRPIWIEMVPAGSGDAMERILSERDQAAIWSPASTILLPVAQERWAAAHNGAALFDGTPQPLVLSPVVIAMWKPMAEALGWPAKPLGWSDIAALASERASWADYGHPEWGSFQFGHTHPDFSNSGITSILATGYAAAGKTRGLTLEDTRQASFASFMEQVESGVIHYGESTGFFATQMFSRGPGYLSAAVMYENLVVESYDRARYPSRPLDVVAVYPREGTFWSDHPFVIPNAPWMTDELRDAAERYRAFLLERPQQERALTFGFRPADSAVPIGEPLTAAHGVDARQPQTLLEVPSAEVIEAVRGVWGAYKKRVDVQVVLDISGSMADEGRLEQAKTALAAFIDRLADQDGLGITVFSDTAAELTPLDELGPKRADVKQRVGSLFPDGGTRLIDTVTEQYHRLEQLPRGERIRALVVLSDGADNASTGTADALSDLLNIDEEGSSIKVFTIAYGTGSDVDRNLMQAIADASGAKMFTSDPATIDTVYREIATFF